MNPNVRKISKRAHPITSFEVTDFRLFPATGISKDELVRAIKAARRLKIAKVQMTKNISMTVGQDEVSFEYFGRGWRTSCGTQKI